MISGSEWQTRLSHWGLFLLLLRVLGCWICGCIRLVSRNFLQRFGDLSGKLDCHIGASSFFFCGFSAVGTAGAVALSVGTSCKDLGV